jgi:hypothetical protein
LLTGLKSGPTIFHRAYGSFLLSENKSNKKAIISHPIYYKEFRRNETSCSNGF